MDRVKEYENKLNQELSKYECAVKVEKRTGVRKTYLASGVAVLVLLLVVMNVAGQLIVNLVGFVYPMWASLAALKTSSTADDTQWLTYWVAFGMLAVLDYFSSFILYYVPFYYLFKLVVVLYLALPPFRGAELLYQRFLKDLPLGCCSSSSSSSPSASQGAASGKEKSG